VDNRLVWSGDLEVASAMVHDTGSLILSSARVNDWS
jgi:hypothetical protein